MVLEMHPAHTDRWGPLCPRLPGAVLDSCRPEPVREPAAKLAEHPPVGSSTRGRAVARCGGHPRLPGQQAQLPTGSRQAGPVPSPRSRYSAGAAGASRSEDGDRGRRSRLHADARAARSTAHLPVSGTRHPRRRGEPAHLFFSSATRPARRSRTSATRSSGQHADVDGLIPARNPISTPARVLDIFLQAYAISAVAFLAGSFGAFFHRRGFDLTRHPARRRARGCLQRSSTVDQVGRAARVDLVPSAAAPRGGRVRDAPPAARAVSSTRRAGSGRGRSTSSPTGARAAQRSRSRISRRVGSATTSKSRHRGPGREGGPRPTPYCCRWPAPGRTPGSQPAAVRPPSRQLP